MKRKWHHPDEPKTGKRYWRSIGELEDTAEFRGWLEREFPQGAAELADDDSDLARRNFLKLMGASTALAGFGLTGCSRPVKNIVPYANNVEWVIPGKPLLYTSAMPFPGGARPVVVTTHEGRPTHIQGNAHHPAGNGGGADSFTVASVLDLYDPDRLRGFYAYGEGSSAAAFQDYIDGQIAQMDTVGGQGTALLLDESPSPTADRLVAQLRKQYPKLRTYRHEVVDKSGAQSVSEAAFGAPVNVIPDLAKADKIFALDCDFLGTNPLGGSSVHAFAERRGGLEPDDSMNRLYVAENRYTQTGSMADHRLPIPASQVSKLAAMLARSISEITGNPGPAKLATGALGEVKSVGEMDGATVKKWVEEAARDLAASKGAAVVLAGAQQPAVVHALAAAINSALDAYGNTLNVLATGAAIDGHGGLAQLSEDVRDGKISSLISLTAGDPVYDAPGELAWAETMAGIETTVCLSPRRSATTDLSQWVIPAAHYLEAWGDSRSADGTYSVVQPMIAPLYGGVSALEVLLALAGEKSFAPVDSEGDAAAAPPVDLPGVESDDAGYLAVQSTFRELAGKGWPRKWNLALRDGFLAGSAYPAAEAGAPTVGKLASIVDASPSYDAPTAGSVEVVFPPDNTVFDGRYANNGWQQEVPDPITKLTWDNAAQVSPRLMKAWGKGGKLLKDGTLIEIATPNGTLEVPVMTAPGHAQNSITLPLGYGKTVCGRVGDNVGFNTAPLRSSAQPYFATGASATPTRGNYILATTAEHYSMEARAIARETTAEAFADDPKGVQLHGMDAHIPENISLYHGQTGVKEGTADKGYIDALGKRETEYGFDYEREHQWAMTIDLSRCISCTACSVACQSENNIPIVGKTQVLNHREMHWIRMDRYFATTDNVTAESTDDDYIHELDNPEMITQPVACVQCESAPCETVCPVNATVHTEEGLNAMAYNRCIGTRYCANNCPYKARRFNYFDYNKRDVLKKRNLAMGPLGERADKDARVLQKNPNVSVRMRGVMEKCTYCVQRLEAAKIDHRRVNKGTADTMVPDGKVKVACQQACPTGAIAFGNIADPESAVSKAKQSPRNYDLLKYIGTMPRTSYLARVKNPNTKMPGSERIGRATADFH